MESFLRACDRRAADVAAAAPPPALDVMNYASNYSSSTTKDVELEILSLADVLAELELADKYSTAFANAGIGDDDLNRARGDADAVAHIIQAVSLRGGSATIFKRKLMLQPVLPKEAAPVRKGQHQQPRRKPQSSQTNPSGGAAEDASSKPSQRQLTANADGLFKLASEADLALMLERTPTVVVEFKARWCGGCKIAEKYLSGVTRAKLLSSAE